MSNIESPMKGGLDEHCAKAKNPFFRAPYSPFYLPEPFDPGASRTDLLRRLKSRLAQMDALCFDKEATLRPGEPFWPSEPWLDEISENIRRLSSLHRRGGMDLWSCIKAIDNRYPALRLSGKITKLVDRAAKLYYEPLAIAIQRQAIVGNQVAYGCFAALRRCYDRSSEIRSEDWKQFLEILEPRSGETCEAKAAQIVIDWVREDLSPHRHWDPLASWVSTMGHPPLVARLMRPDSATHLLFGPGNKIKRRVSAAIRQKAYRRRKNHPIRLSLMRILSTPAKPSRAVRAKK